MNESDSPAVRAISHSQLERPLIEESSEVFRRQSFPPGVHRANPYPNLIGQQGVVGRIQAAWLMFFESNGRCDDLTGRELGPWHCYVP